MLTKEEQALLKSFEDSAPRYIFEDEVTIFGETFTFSTPYEDLENTAAFLDAEMRTTAEAHPDESPLRIAIITAMRLVYTL